MKHSILIAEDQIEQATALAGLLNSKYDVSIVQTVAEAKSMLEHDRSKTDPNKRFAIIIIDLWFQGHKPDPEKAGFEILKEAQKDPFLEPIIYTGTGNEAKASIASSMDVHRYVTKGETIHDKLASKRLMLAIEGGIELRKKMIKLVTDIEKLRKAVPQLKRLDISDSMLSAAAEVLFGAEATLKAILHLRGNKADL